VAPQKHRTAEPRPGRARGERGKSLQASAGARERCLLMSSSDFPGRSRARRVVPRARASSFGAAGPGLPPPQPSHILPEPGGNTTGNRAAATNSSLRPPARPPYHPSRVAHRDGKRRCHPGRVNFYLDEDGIDHEPTVRMVPWRCRRTSWRNRSMRKPEPRWPPARPLGRTGSRPRGQRSLTFVRAARGYRLTSGSLM
jgi:hypothetical protein